MSEEKGIIYELLQRATSKDDSVATDAIRKLAQHQFGYGILDDVGAYSVVKNLSRRHDEVGRLARHLSLTWRAQLSSPMLTGLPKEDMHRRFITIDKPRSSGNADGRAGHKDLGKYNTSRSSKMGQHSAEPSGRCHTWGVSSNSHHQSKRSINAAGQIQIWNDRALETPLPHSGNPFERSFRDPHSSRYISKLHEEKDLKTVDNSSRLALAKRAPSDHHKEKEVHELHQLHSSNLALKPSCDTTAGISIKGKGSRHLDKRESLSSAGPRPPSAQSHKFPSSSKPRAIKSNKVSVTWMREKELLLRENHPYPSPSEDLQINGFMDEGYDLASSSSRKDASQIMNGSLHRSNPRLESGQTHSKESSHVEVKEYPHRQEGSSKPHKTVPSHKRVPSHGKDANSEKYSFKPRHRSPEIFHPDSQYSSPRKKGQYVFPASHLSLNQSPSRPDMSSSLGDCSNDDRPLPDESRHLLIDNAENTILPNSEQSPKAHAPYYIEMREGMFVAVKVGSSRDVLKVRELKYVGSCELVDGGFSWGWSIERRTLSPYSTSRSSPASKEKHGPIASRDVITCKRKIDYDKIDSATLDHKKPLPPRNQDCSMQRKTAATSNGWDAEGNKVSEWTPTDEEKGIRRASHPADKPHRQHSPMVKKHSPVSVPQRNIKKVDCDMKGSIIDDTTMGFISSKKDRRTIYSGRKTAHDIPSLKAICLNSLHKNILNIKVSESVPFERLLPVLEQCGPAKLRKIEEQNKHLHKYTDNLWQKFCRRKFPDIVSNDGFPWKNIYWRALKQQELKLQNLKDTISNGMAKAHPERQAKFMVVDAHNPEKRQKKMKIEETPVKIEVNGRSSGKSSGSESSSSPKLIVQKACKVTKCSKRTVAPLMSKAKKMVSMVSRRR